MTIFPRNNLPTGSLNWSREVEKAVNNLESTFRSAEINNVTRDSQLQSSYKRLDAALTELKTTTTAADDALSAAITAQSTANTANTTAIAANTAATNANTTAIAANSTAITANTRALEALQDIVDLGSPGGPTINVANLTAGTLSGDRISGGVITGTQLTTANAGNQRVILNSNRITLNNGSADTGSIYGSVYGSTNATYIEGNACVLSSTQGNYFVGTTGVFGGNFSSEFDVLAGRDLSAGSGFLKLGASTFSRNSAGQMEGPGFRATGNLNVAGQFFYDAPTATGTTYPLYINISTNQVYRLSSSQRYKTQIQDAEFDYEALLQARVRTFKNKQEVEENGAENAELTYGYIAEELHDLGLTDFVVYEPDENGNIRPESVNYMSMALATHEMLKVQDQKLKSLEERLAALEDRVQ